MHFSALTHAPLVEKSVNSAHVFPTERDFTQTNTSSVTAQAGSGMWDQNEPHPLQRPLNQQHYGEDLQY